MKTASEHIATRATVHPAPPFFRRGEESAEVQRKQPFFGSQHTFFRPQPIQPKLSINAPGDVYEQEADAMAERVMQLPEAAISTPPLSKGGSGGDQTLMRDTEEQSLTHPPLSSEGSGGNQTQAAPTIQRTCAACEQEQLQREEIEEEVVQPQLLMRKTQNGGYEASPQLENQLQTSKGGGSPLAKPTLGFMNQAFGRDFSNVRVHTGTQAAEMSKDIQAKAFTHGSDIYFNQGQYSPESSDGKKLLAHELTHVGQQGGGDNTKGASWYRGQAIQNLYNEILA